MAVGRDRFRTDAQAVMAFMQQLATKPMESDDPTQSYMLQVGSLSDQLCVTLCRPALLAHDTPVLPAQVSNDL